jgi:uncharacterized protein
MSQDRTGLELHEAHFPRRAPISAYGRGGFRFADMSHRGALLCLPSGIYAWHAAPPSGAPLIANLERVFLEADEIGVLLIGTGTDLVPVNAELRARCQEVAIVVETMATGAAVRTFNVLLADDRPVAAAFIAVD